MAEQIEIKFVKTSKTSKSAAASVEGVAPTLRARVHDYIASQGEAGATDDEIELALSLRHQTASARRRELVLNDSIIDSGRTRVTSSGRKATVWTCR